MFGDDYWWADLTRLLVCAAALWLSALVLRLAWNRRHDHRTTDKPSTATYVSYAGCLLLLVAMRIDHFGQVPTWDLYVAVAIVALGMYGVLKRVKITPPLQGRNHGTR